MEQDEKIADEFRDNLLLMRCWDIWRQGHIWIVVRNLIFEEAFPDQLSVDYTSTDSRSSRQTAP